MGVNLLTCLNQPYNQNNFAYKDYDDTTTVGHQDKIIGIPKSDATVIYPYEWRIDALMDDKLTSDLQLSDAEKVTVENYEKKGTHGTLPTGHRGKGSMWISLSRNIWVMRRKMKTVKNWKYPTEIIIVYALCLPATGKAIPSV